MPARVMNVLADDLTGACEIAGIAYRKGLDAVVCLGSLSNKARTTDVLVVDTETRLESPARAAEIVSDVIARHGFKHSRTALFKKVDSVLRGPIAAELGCLAHELGLSRILLVPGNPELGRTVSNGSYFVRGEPIHQTPFADDPHHPARSSSVRELVGDIPGFASHILNHHSPLPADGLIFGDVENREDLAAWARTVKPGTVTAGAAAFFAELLEAKGSASTLKASAPPEGPILIVSGTTVPEQRAHIAGLSEFGSVAQRLPVPTPVTFNLDPWIEEICRHLKNRGRVCVFPDGEILRNPESARIIRENLAEAVRQAVMSRSAHHIVVEGGATAAAIAERLDWAYFRIIREWAPGVVSLQPENRPDFIFTIKPGSYPWPAALEAAVIHPTPDLLT